MEEMIMQSAMVELDLWKIFAESRQANSNVFIATVIAVWIAARFYGFSPKIKTYLPPGIKTVSSILNFVIQYTLTKIYLYGQSPLWKYLKD